MGLGEMKSVGALIAVLLATAGCTKQTMLGTDVHGSAGYLDTCVATTDCMPGLLCEAGFCRYATDAAVSMDGAAANDASRATDAIDGNDAGRAVVACNSLGPDLRTSVLLPLSASAGAYVVSVDDNPQAFTAGARVTVTGVASEYLPTDAGVDAADVSEINASEVALSISLVDGVWTEDAGAGFTVLPPTFAEDIVSAADALDFSTILAAGETLDSTIPIQLKEMSVRADGVTQLLTELNVRDADTNAHSVFVYATYNASSWATERVSVLGLDYRSISPTANCHRSSFPLASDTEGTIYIYGSCSDAANDSGDVNFLVTRSAAGEWSTRPSFVDAVASPPCIGLQSPVAITALGGTPSIWFHCDGWNVCDGLAFCSYDWATGALQTRLTMPNISTGLESEGAYAIVINPQSIDRAADGTIRFAYVQQVYCDTAEGSCTASTSEWPTSSVGLNGETLRGGEHDRLLLAECPPGGDCGCH